MPTSKELMAQVEVLSGELGKDVPENLKDMTNDELAQTAKDLRAEKKPAKKVKKPALEVAEGHAIVRQGETFKAGSEVKKSWFDDAELKKHIEAGRVVQNG